MAPADVADHTHPLSSLASLVDFRNRLYGISRAAGGQDPIQTLPKMASCLLVTIFFGPSVFDFNKFIRPVSQSGIQNSVGQATL